MAPKKKKGFIVAILNDKGGIGKTIIASNLAAALSLKGKNTLLVDLDPQCDATDAVIGSKNEIDESIYQIINPEIQDKPNIENCIYSTIHKNLDIIPNVEDTSSVWIPLSKNYPESNMCLREGIRDYAINNYNFTIIDCPPTLCSFVLNAVYSADAVIIPIMAGSSNSLKGIKRILDLIDATRETGNSGLNFLKILFNKIDKRKSVHKANLTDAERRFGKENIFKASVPTFVEFENVEHIQRATIFSKNPHSKGADAFRKIAKEVTSILK